MNKQISKTIYITTECNLECTYCYEKRKRDEGFPIKSVTDKEIDLLIKSILEYTGNNIIIILFGGEPFLKPDLLEKTVDKVIKECSHIKNINFMVNTNGTLLKQNSELVKKLYTLNVYFIISYDGDFNSDRIFPDGTDSRYCVEENIEWMKEMGYPFGISSVVEENNEFFIHNILKILLHYKPKKIVLRIKDGKAVKGVENKLLLKKLELVYKKLKIPICDAVCHVCSENCEKENTYQEYIIPENNKIITITFEERKRGYVFDHF